MFLVWDYQGEAGVRLVVVWFGLAPAVGLVCACGLALVYTAGLQVERLIRGLLVEMCA